MICLPVSGCSEVTGEMMRRSVWCVVCMVSECSDEEKCNDDVNGCDDVVGEMACRLVGDVFAAGEVRSGGVRVCSHLSPRLLSPGS